MRFSLLAVILAAFSLPALAQVHICKTPDGNTVFQDAPCSVHGSDAADECDRPMSFFEQRIQSGQGNYIDQRCLDRLQSEARVQARLEAEKAREAEETKQRLEKRREYLAKQAEWEAEEARALRTAKAKLVKPENPELTKIQLENACKRRVIATHAFKDPGSVRVEGSEYAWLTEGGRPRYAILLYANAKNGWGAYAGAKKYQCLLSDDGLRLSDAR